jgi:hypothetical protein
MVFTGVALDTAVAWGVEAPSFTSAIAFIFFPLDSVARLADSSISNTWLRPNRKNYENQFSVFSSRFSVQFSVRRRGCQPSFLGIFHRLICQMSSLPREEFSTLNLQRTRERPPHSTTINAYHFEGRRQITSNLSADPLLSCTCIASPRLSSDGV